MNPWLETLGVATLAVAGAWMGFHCARLPRWWWLAGYLIPLSMIIVIGLGRRFPSMETWPPGSWLMQGRTEFALTGLLSTMMLTTLIPKLKFKRDRAAVGVLMASAVGLAALPPFAAPMLHERQLTFLPTVIDTNGVCRQSTDFSCGPAAAVSALRRLGLRAEEGELALLARATSFTGTEPDVLAMALRERYAKDGLQAEYRHFNSVDELRGPHLTIARIKFSYFLDHYVTVLEVRDQDLVVADPLYGLECMPRVDFESVWRRCGVVLSLTNASSATPSLGR